MYMIDLLILFWTLVAVSLLAWVVMDSRPAGMAEIQPDCDTGHNFGAVQQTGQPPQ